MSKPRFQLSLGARIFLATALLVTLAVTAAVSVTYLLGTRIADRAVRETLGRAGLVQSNYQDTLIEQVRFSAYQVAGDPYFSAYVSESLELGDVPSLRDQLEERQRELEIDLLLVLDAEGFAVAQASEMPSLAEDFSRDPLFLLTDEEFDGAGIWARDDKLFYAAVVPIGVGDVLVGFLIAAEVIDDGQANTLAQVSDTEVAFFRSGDTGSPWIATTLDPDLADDLIRETAQRPDLLDVEALTTAGSGQHLEIRLRQRAWLTLIRPLADISGQPVGAVINLASLQEQLEPYLQICRIFAGVGLLAILLALLMSYLLPRKVLQPISQLATVAAAAAEGDYDQEIRAESSDEVGRLAGAFSTLLSELREKRDMEIYVNELTRNLPDPDGGTREAVPAQRREVTLLGIELRDYIDSLGSTNGTAAQILDRFTRDLRRIARAIRSYNGKIEAILGHRLLASFEGNRRADRALSATGDILREGKTHVAALAMASGSTILGTITWDNRPDYALTGELVEQVEGLLRVARPGSLLLAQSSQQELSQTLTQAGIQPREHRSTVSAVPLFSLTPEETSRFTGLEMSATLDMTQADSTFAPATTLSGVGVGSVLGERFELLSELGAGGMGVVYKALDRTLDELVALKMLKQDLWGDQGRLEGLKEELKLARKISHPNVLRTFDFGDADSFPFISMEYVRGITLKHLLDQSGRLPLSAGLRLARQLCKGLAAAHARGVLHRDIKPENLIIEPNGNSKLMDFGIAKPIQRQRIDQTQPGMLVGTPFYVAPEQLEGVEADERSDIYACGVVFYEIFTGALPYPAGGGLGDIIQRKLHADPTPPREQWPEIPPTLESIINRCLERDREERFRDVPSLLEELERLRA